MRLSNLAWVAALALVTASAAWAEENAAPAEAAATDETMESAAPESTEAAAAGTELGPVGYDAQGRAGRIHVVRDGDTLWDVSDAYLGTPWVWPSVWKDNDDIANPHLIYPGDRIWISPYEMRKITAAEAEEMMNRSPGEEPPAAIDQTPVPVDHGTYRFTGIQTTGFIAPEELAASSSILDAVHLTRRWFGQQDEVVVGLGAGEVQVGEQYDIFRTAGEIEDPETGELIGYETKQLGWLEVTAVEDESAVAEIRLSRSEMQRGDRIIPRRMRNADIPVMAMPQVDGLVAHLPNERQAMGSTDIVYLNKGSRDGLVVGSPLEIFRPKDAVEDVVDGVEKRIPDHIVAKLVVVDVFDNSAVAVVTHTTHELGPGDRFRGTETLRP